MSAHYTGELDLQFLRHGKGEYKYPNNVFRFSGGWKSGTKSGKGVFEVEGWSTIEGNFVDGEIEGLGSKQWVDGRRYEGNFSRGEACGEGRFKSPSGESYVGTWAQNKRHGRGQLVLPNGQGTYTGEFQRHRFHGEGELLLANGFQYSGTFFSGLPHGLGSAVYPGGSTFDGPFESGRKSGIGGKYLCAVTGICWVGGWAAGKAIAPPSKLAIDPESADKAFGAGAGGAGQGKATKAGGKAEKSGGGKKGGKANKKDVEEPDGSGLEKPVVAHFNGDGTVVGMWFRCVRDCQDTLEPPSVPPEPHVDAEEPTRSAKEHQRDLVSDESGRTLAVTLHEVAESLPRAIGEPVPFFVRRPDANDVSESLGRFPVDGLVALFQLDKRSYPKGPTCYGAGAGDQLVVVPGTKSAPDTPVEPAEPEPPAKDSKGSKDSKSKGGEKGGSEQPTPGDGGVDAQWQAIRSEVQSTHCLVIGAGDNFLVASPPLFVGHGRNEATESEKGGSSPPGDGDISRNLETEGRGVQAGVHDGTSPAGCIEETGDIPDHEEPATMIDGSSPFAVCLDFRLELAEALLNVEDRDEKPSGENGDVSGGEGDVSVADKVVRILSCGSDVEVFAVIRLRAPAEALPFHAEAEHAAEIAHSGGETSSAASPPADDARTKGGRALDDHTAATPLSSRSSSDDGNAVASATPTWHLDAMLVRSGSYVGAVPCVSPAEKVAQQRQQHPGDDPPESSAPERRRVAAVYGLDEWHALALVANNGGGEPPISLCIDGDVLELQQDAPGATAIPAGGTESELLTSGAVVVGGTGGEWAALAVKNLAVYKEGLGSDQLRAITRVFRAWREEQQAAQVADEQEDERWAEETRKAEEEGREPDERPEWLAGADPAKILLRKTVHGEAKFDKIVLPKAALEAGEWILRVEDVSHGREEDRNGSSGRPRALGSAESAVSIGVAPAADEETNAFPPLPGETIKLERA